MKRLWSALLPTVILMVATLGAEDEPFAAPPPPADGILDEARLFVRSPERHQVIAAALARLEEQHGFRLYYVLYDALYGRDPGEQAHLLRQAWLGDRPGMVLVLETDSGIFQIGRAETRPTEIEPGTKVPIAGPADLSQVELSRLIRDLEGSLRGGLDGEDAERLAVGMADGVAAILAERAAAPEGGTRTRMIVLAVGLIAATGLIALLVVAGLKRAEARSLERYVFPKVKVGIRLGAPYGGGKVSSRTFRTRGQR